VKSFIVDASVGAKWATPAILEPLADQADRFLNAYAAGTIHIVVPDLFWLEIGSFLWKAAKRGTITSTLAASALDAMLLRDFPTVPSRTFLKEAFKIASSFDRTLYDSVYVAIAAATETDLITADERLVNALGSRFPVRWLGAY
jgi:predicted nucleic acid-binding protein